MHVRNISRLPHSHLQKRFNFCNWHDTQIKRFTNCLRTIGARKHQRRGEFADFLADRSKKMGSRWPDERTNCPNRRCARLSHKHGIMAPRRPPQLKTNSRRNQKKINHICGSDLLYFHLGGKSISSNTRRISLNNNTRDANARRG